MDAFRKGGSFAVAAHAAGVSKAALVRYAQKHPAFGDAVEAAKAESGRQERADYAAAVTRSKAHELDAESKPDADVPSADQLAASAITGIDVDLIMDADAHMPTSSEPIEVDGRVLPELTVYNALLFHWRLMHDTSEHHMLRAKSADIMARMQFQLQLEAQQARNARRETLAMRAAVNEQDTSEGVIDAPRASGGMVVLEVPPNKARPHLGRAHEAMDAELVE